MRDRVRGAGPPRAGVTVSAVGNLAALERHRQEWSELAGRAIEANVFYEPEMLLPALRDLQPSPGWLVLLIHQGGRLIGLVPLQRQALGGFRTGLMLSGIVLGISWGRVTRVSVAGVADQAAERAAAGKRHPATAA